MPKRTDRPAVLPIVQLVRREVARIGKPLREIAGDGDVIKYGTLRRYNDVSLRLDGMPRTETMRQLAAVFRLDMDEVREAFHESVYGKPNVTERNPRPEGEVDRVSVSDAAEDGRYVAHRLADDPPAGGLSDEEVLALIRENRRLSDELERRILRDGPVEGAP